jgi:hypothetical protein
MKSGLRYLAARIFNTPPVGSSHAGGILAASATQRIYYILLQLIYYISMYYF